MERIVWKTDQRPAAAWRATARGLLDLRRTHRRSVRWGIALAATVFLAATWRGIFFVFIVWRLQAAGLW